MTVRAFNGHANFTQHHSTKRRAWCACGEWCYPDISMACSCCLRELAAENPCPCCDGTGIKDGTPENVEEQT